METSTEVRFAGGILGVYALWVLAVILQEGFTLASSVNIGIAVLLLAGTAGLLQLKQWGLYVAGGGIILGILLAITGFLPGGVFSIIFLAILADIYKGRTVLS